MGNVRIGSRPVSEDLVIPDGFPKLANVTPIPIHWARDRGVWEHRNPFVVMEKQIGASIKDSWHLAPPCYCATSQELRARMLEREPSASIRAGGTIDLFTLAFDYADERTTHVDLKGFVIRAFAAVQMDGFWRYEQAIILVDGMLLEGRKTSIGDLLAMHGLKIQRRH